MTTPAPSRGEQVVRALAAAGLVGTDRHDEAVRVVDRALGDAAEPPSSLRRRLPEIAGYLGAAFVTAAVVLLVARQWDGLTTATRVSLLAALAALLFAAAYALARTTGGAASLRTPEHSVRRRLTSTIATAGAGAGAAAVLVGLIELSEGSGDLRDGALIGLGAASAFVLLCLVGYALAPSLLGQLATAIGAAYAVVFGVQAATLDPDGVRIGLAFVALGVLWLLLAEQGWWRELPAARGIGLALVLAGAQAPLAEPDYRWVAYLMTTLVAAAGFWMYVARQAWPYLVLGVVGVTVVVPEVVLDWTDGSTLGAGTALLAAGVALLAASLLGQRLRRQVDPAA